MPDELEFQREDGSPLNEITYSRNVRGIPSVPVPFYVKNLSGTHTARGVLRVTPTDGPSWSSDLYISSGSYDTWGRALDIDIPPGEKVKARTRVIARNTPSGVLGRGAITPYVEWFTV